jgi:hypothetical protein
VSLLLMRPLRTHDSYMDAVKVFVMEAISKGVSVVNAIEFPL